MFKQKLFRNALFTIRYANSNNPRKKKVLAFTLVCVGLFLLWCVLFFFLVFRTGIYHEAWAAFTSFPDALRRFFTFSLRVSTVQAIPALLALLGIIYSIRHKQYAWISVSFALAAFMYIVAAGINGVFRYALLGLWYNDPYRLAANLAIIAIPLIVLGLF